MRSFSRYALTLFPVMLGVVLTVHFTMTVVYLMPFNPIALRVKPIVEQYMTPWFVQDWHLFAPNPINETRMLLISCRLRQGNGITVESAWADISTPLWEAQAHQRFSAAGWLIRPQTHAAQRYFDQNEVLIALDHYRTVEGSAVNDLAEAIRVLEEGRRAFAVRVLTRLGSAYCDRWYGTGQTVATRASLAVLRFPRFSQRHLPDADGTLGLYLFPWMPYERVSPPTGTGR